VKRHAVSVRHNFETAHRLPILGGKCSNLHGHSWWADISIESPHLEDGVLVEFGCLKRRVRTWIDDNLDHGAMLGHQDLLVGALSAVGSKVFVFGEHPLTDGLDWPTVENVAELIARATMTLLADGDGCGSHPAAQVAHVKVTETHVNAAHWTETQ
jgi:6-pyruvoyl-tetrahydropterin synthase